jgi:O-succinylbenzoate synthase
MIEELKSAIKSGYASIKIKVGNGPVEQDIALIKEMQQILPSHVTLRLDANRSWSIKDAISFSRGIREKCIAFIEEPLADDADYETYDREQHLPFALDESLTGRKIGAIPGWKNLRALVLKPVLLGGPEFTRKWMEWAHSRGIVSVISSVFESGIGIRSLISLAASNRDPQPMGIDTYARLAEDVFSPPLIFENGYADTNQLSLENGSPNLTLLKELE